LSAGFFNLREIWLIRILAEFFGQPARIVKKNSTEMSH